MSRNLMVVAVSLVASLVYVSCKNESKKRGGGNTVVCPANYYYSATPPRGYQQTTTTQFNSGSNGGYNNGYQQTTTTLYSNNNNNNFNNNNGGYTYNLQGNSSQVTWANVGSIVQSKCASCHRLGGTPPDLSSYNAARNSGQALVSSIIGNRMPQGNPLSANEKQMFSAWQAGNFLENATANNGFGSTTQPYNNNSGGYGTGGYGYTTTTQPYNNGNNGNYNNSNSTGVANVPAGCYPNSMR